MGKRGPKPQPAVLKLIRGNPGKRAIDLSDGVHPEVAEPPMPRWMSDLAKREWKRIVPELKELGLISRLDMAALALYCQCYGRLVLVEQSIAKRQAEIEQAGGAGADALLKTTPTGFTREDALSKIATDMRVQVDRYLAAFGLSPSSRSRVLASRNDGQLQLPGVDAAGATPSWGGFR